MVDLKKVCLECQVKNSDKFIAQIDKLFEILIEYNKNVNLTRITEYEDFLIKHVIDSLIIGKFFPEFSKYPLSVADIGCGAGFPSLVLALAYPNLQVTAIDSIAKKTAFVKFAGETLGLTNLKVITGRSKEMNCKFAYKSRFDIVTARAVADAKTVYLEAKNFPKKSGGSFILYKTPEQLVEDFPSIKQADSFHKWQVSEVYELPNSSGSRQFLYY